MAKALTSWQKEKSHGKNLTVKRTRLIAKRITSSCGKKKKTRGKKKNLAAKGKTHGKKNNLTLRQKEKTRSKKKNLTAKRKRLSFKISSIPRGYFNSYFLFAVR